MRRILFAIFLIMACATGAAAGALEDAEFASQGGDHAREAKLLRPFAEQGDAQAQCNLGKLYYEGKGVPQDYREALRWYRKAAKQGNEEAQFNLTGMYASGQGIPQGAQEAAM
jgi:TPR repeat protein